MTVSGRSQQHRSLHAESTHLTRHVVREMAQQLTSHCWIYTRWRCGTSAMAPAGERAVVVPCYRPPLTARIAPVL